eukprot:g43450.t1
MNLEEALKYGKESTGAGSKSRAASPHSLEHCKQRALQPHVGCEPQGSVGNSTTAAHGEAATEHYTGSECELVAQTGAGSPRQGWRGCIPRETGGPSPRAMQGPRYESWCSATYTMVAADC